jgi:hypothetical protein
MSREKELRKKKKKKIEKHQCNKMGINEDVEEERVSLVYTCCSQEALIIFKTVKKCVMGKSLWKSFGLRCVKYLSCELRSWP